MGTGEKTGILLQGKMIFDVDKDDLIKLSKKLVLELHFVGKMVAYEDKTFKKNDELTEIDFFITKAASPKDVNISEKRLKKIISSEIINNDSKRDIFLPLEFLFKKTWVLSGYIGSRSPKNNKRYLMPLLIVYLELIDTALYSIKWENVDEEESTNPQHN